MKLLVITRKVDRNDALAGFTYGWIQEFSKHVETLHVICLEQGDISELPSHVHIHSLGKERGKNRLREFIRFHRFAKSLVRTVDGVFAHQNPEYGILIAPWAKLYRKKLISWYTHKAVTWKLRVLEFLSDTIVTASKESFRLPSSKLVVLQHGIDTDFFSPQKSSPGHEHVILSVSRISPSKNIQLMIELVEVLHARGLPIKLHIVGGPAVPRDEEYVSHLHAMIERKNLHKVVSLLGPIPFSETPDVYRNSGLFLNFSETGSLDKAVLEAMSCGVPVLVANEAFKNILLAIDERLYSRLEIEDLADKAYSLLTDSGIIKIQSSIREYVVSHHALSLLISRIMTLYTA